MSVDPSGFPDGPNAHFYAPNPMREIDPLGLAATEFTLNWTVPGTSNNGSVSGKFHYVWNENGSLKSSSVSNGPLEGIVSYQSGVNKYEYSFLGSDQSERQVIIEERADGSRWTHDFLDLRAYVVVKHTKDIYHENGIFIESITNSYNATEQSFTVIGKSYEL